MGFSSDPLIKPVEARSNSIVALVLGLLLLIPGVVLYGYIQVVPAFNVYQMSFTDYSILRDPEPVGSANYERLMEDRLFTESVGNTLVVVAMRLFIVALVPPIIGLLAGAQAAAGRTLIRSITIVAFVLAVPITIGLFARLFIAPVWGTQSSPLMLSDSFRFNSIEGARNIVLTIDGIITIAIAAAVGGSAFMAVARGREISYSSARAGIAVWLLGLFLADASFSNTFDLPFFLTSGGPANATTTLPFYLFRTGFQAFRFGLAASAATIQMLPAVIGAIFIWLIIIGFRLRLSFTPAPKATEGAGLFGVLSLPITLLLLLPVFVLTLFAIWLAAANPGDTPPVDVGRVLNNTFMGPLLAIWVVQIPITWLMSLALGFIRPVHRIFTEIVFLLLLIAAFLPSGSLMFDWFLTGRDLGALNTTLYIGFAQLVSPFSLLIFKLFFDGSRERYLAARAAGQDASDAFLNTVFLPSLPMALLVGTVLTLLAAGSMMWPLVAVNEVGNYTYPVYISHMLGQFGADGDLVARTALPFVLVLAAVFVPILLLLGTLVVDRLAILAGPDAAYAIPKRKKRADDVVTYEGF